MSNKVKIAVLVSGGGTNLGAIIKAEADGIIKSGTVSLVISNVTGAYALTRAENAGIEALTVTKKACGSIEAFEERLIAEIDSRGIGLIVLAGFMSILSERFTSHYRDRIINVHPALIPSFCGKGYYGLGVHKAALEYGVKVTGATVHFVNEIPDGGKIITFRCGVGAELYRLYRHIHRQRRTDRIYPTVDRTAHRMVYCEPCPLISAFSKKIILQMT